MRVILAILIILQVAWARPQETGTRISQVEKKCEEFDYLLQNAFKTCEARIDANSSAETETAIPTTECYESSSEEDEEDSGIGKDESSAEEGWENSGTEEDESPGPEEEEISASGDSETSSSEEDASSNPEGQVETSTSVSDVEPSVSAVEEEEVVETGKGGKGKGKSKEKGKEQGEAELGVEPAAEGLIRIELGYADGEVRNRWNDRSGVIHDEQVSQEPPAEAISMMQPFNADKKSSHKGENKNRGKGDKNKKCCNDKQKKMTECVFGELQANDNGGLDITKLLSKLQEVITEEEVIEVIDKGLERCNKPTKAKKDKEGENKEGKSNKGKNDKEWKQNHKVVKCAGKAILKGCKNESVSFKYVFKCFKGGNKKGKKEKTTKEAKGKGKLDVMNNRGDAP